MPMIYEIFLKATNNSFKLIKLQNIQYIIYNIKEQQELDLFIRVQRSKFKFICIGKRKTNTNWLAS